MVVFSPTQEGKLSAQATLAHLTWSDLSVNVHARKGPKTILCEATGFAAPGCAAQSPKATGLVPEESGPSKHFVQKLELLLQAPDSSVLGFAGGITVST